MNDDENIPRFPLRNLPRYEELRARTARYPELDPSAVEATLVLFRVSSDALAAFDAHAARIKITPGRLSVLTILNRNPARPMSPSVLADRAGVTRATMTGLLARLARDRMVRRTTDRGDRRKVTVSLTPKGQAFLDAVLPDYYRRIAALMGSLSEDERHQLTDMLYRISERVSAMRTTSPDVASPERVLAQTV